MPDTAGAACHLGVDAQRAFRNGTGLGNYSRRLLQGLRAARPDLPLTLYAARGPTADYASLPRTLGATVHLPPPAWRAGPLPALWRTFRTGRAARRDGVTLYHGLSHEIPRDLPGTGIRAVVTVHDLLFHRHPELFRRPDRWSYAWRYRWSAARADAIIAVSAATRDDLISCFAIDPARIVVIPPARDPRFDGTVPPEVVAATRATHGLPESYLLSVGTLERRKNQVAAIEALGRLGAAAPPLVLVGRDGGTEAELRTRVQQLGLADRVRFLPDVPDADLPAIVQGASVFVYPSRAEGFGMPIVEALGAGVPVVAADVACLHEAGGTGSAYVPADDPEQFAATVRTILEHGDRAEAMRRAGQRHAAGFDGAVLAQRLLAVYDAVITGRPLSVDSPSRPGDPVPPSAMSRSG